MSYSAPTVMVSSTYYDLRQVRADLESFLSTELGYHALLSEYPSFPVDPDATAIENCRIRVEKNADILVLVVGGRYGFVEEQSSRSVTNLEYLEARAKGIPVYAFVQKSILSVMPLWEANPDADFTSTVDNVRLFEFIRDVRSGDSVWTFEFETAQDIISTLRMQLAHLVKDLLALRQRLGGTSIPTALSTLQGSALRLALEKPIAWEYRLFAQVMSDEIAASSDLKMRYLHGFALGTGVRVPVLEFSDWARPRIDELSRLASVLSRALNERYQVAIGAPGEPGDAEMIVGVARLMAEAYRESMEWSLRVRRVAAGEALAPVLEALAHFPDDIVDKIERLGQPLLGQIDEALRAPEGDEAQRVELLLAFEVSHLDEYTRAMSELEENVQLGLVGDD